MMYLLGVATPFALVGAALALKLPRKLVNWMYS